MTATVKDFKRYRNIPFDRRDNCVLCSTPFGLPLIELPKMPLTEFYSQDPVDEAVGFVDQEFHLCSSCGQGQLRNIISPDVLYGETYATRTTTSPSAVAAVDVFLGFVRKHLGDKPRRNIVEIGCNDLYSLRQFRGQAKRLVGIDPVLRYLNLENETDIEIIPEFFEKVDLNKLELELDVVMSSHTLEHMEHPRQILSTLLERATPETLFCFQFPSLEFLVNEAHFDQLHQQHLNYFSVHSFERLLQDLGAELIDYSFNPDHWGALMVAFRRGEKNSNNRLQAPAIAAEQIVSQYAMFQLQMKAFSKRISALPRESLYGFGAAQMLPLLRYHVEAISELRGIIDDDPKKRGLYYLNLPLRILAPEEVPNWRECHLVITAINSKQPYRAIMRRLIDLGARNILTPLQMI